MFILQNTEQEELELPELRITPYEIDPNVAKFDLTLQAVEREAEIEFSVEYSTALFQGRNNTADGCAFPAIVGDRRK